MKTCLIVSTKPYLYDALASIDTIAQALSLSAADEFRPGFDLVISDTELKTKTQVIELLERPIVLAQAITAIEAYINSIATQLTFADTMLDTVARNLICNGASTPLTEIECKILSALITAPSNALDRDKIKTSVLGYNEEVQTSTIENHIYHLRQKLSTCGLKIDRVENEYRLVC